MSLSKTISSLDLSKKAIDIWNKLSLSEKEEWRNYFSLNTVTQEMINAFPHYSHDYNYHLSGEDILRVIFCSVVEIVRYNQNNNMQRAFVGNSGGLDSAVVCALLARAEQLSKDLGKEFDVIAYGLPLYSNPEHNLRAIETAKARGIRHITIENLDAVFDNLKTVLSPLADDLKFTEEEQKRGWGNVKARIRMIVNFFGTTKTGGYVVSTDNLSELYMAFWTLLGDVGAFGPIQNVLKGLEEPAIACALGVPLSVLGAKPTDGLNIHKSLDEQEGGDTDAFKGVYYPHLDAIICFAVQAGLQLDKIQPVSIDANLIHSKVATQEVVNGLIRQMTSPASVWKRKHGSIGISISRDDLGLIPLNLINL